MAILDIQAVPGAPVAEPRGRHTGWNQLVSIVTTTDHKVIGNLYLVTTFVFFLLGGLLTLVMRAELVTPGLQLVDNLEQYNQLFTMHGTIMLLLFATPLFAGFANALVPLQIGAPDVAFPRLNALSYWLYLLGGLITVAGFVTPGGAASFGWFAYAPLSTSTFSPGLGGDLWVIGLALAGVGTILGSVNFVTTIICLRAPGMTMFRIPVFTWGILITSMMVLMAFPVLTAALLALAAQRLYGIPVFDPANNGPILYQHLFWFFGHPEVYIIALPFFGIISEVIPVFSRKPVFGYKGLIFATIAIAALSLTVWAHHMYATGQVLLPFFAVMSMAIAVPTGVKFFNWIGTMWRGSLTFETPMLWALGFLVTFLFGGLTGIILSSPVLDFHVTDSYFVVAHFHYTVFGTVVFAMFAGFHFWWPKLTGRRLDERLGRLHFWMLFIGFQGTFLIQHLLGIRGMPRRYGDYLTTDGFEVLNQVSTVFAMLLGLSTLPFLFNVWVTWRRAPRVMVDDPWGFGASLEWATSCPPPRHNFDRLPRIRSERPAIDLHYPDLEAASPVTPDHEVVAALEPTGGSGDREPLNERRQRASETTPPCAPRTGRKPQIRIKRVYDDPVESDGYRILVDRLWPRGISKSDVALDEWMKEVAPSSKLRRWFRHDPEKFTEFADRYREELKESGTLEDLAERCREHAVVTLLYGAKDTDHNQAVVLRDLLSL